MNLTLHQLRIEIQAHRQMLLLWASGLVLDLAVNGVVGRFITIRTMVSPGGVTFLWVILSGLLWCLVSCMPTLVVLADSPARQDSFLNTRPMPSVALGPPVCSYSYCCWLRQSCRK